MEGTTEIKSKFHSLIDDFKNDQSLIFFYDMMKKELHHSNSVWESISLSVWQELIDIDKENEDESKLIMHKDILTKYS